MAYALTFCLLAAALVGTAVQFGGAVWLCLYPALAFLVAGLAYAGLGPRVFGKRDDGAIGWPAALLLAPYLGLFWLLWHARRALTREPACQEVAPGLWIGRRPAPAEVPPGVVTIVDLTAEFPESPRVAAGCRYLSRPLLDGTAPSDAALRALAAELAALEGPLLIHCALGHGRSPLAAAALLLERSPADDPEELLRQMRRQRPTVALTKSQKAALKRFAAGKKL